MFNFKSIYRKLLIIMSLLGSLFIPSTANAAIILTFADNNVAPLDPFPSTGVMVIFDIETLTPYVVKPFTAAMGTFPSSAVPAGEGIEFRMIDKALSVGGGGSATLFDGGEQWIFQDNVNFTAVTGTSLTPAGATLAKPGILLTAGSADPGVVTGVSKNADFLTTPFGFLAPIVGSPAAAAYGNGTILVDVNGGTMQVTMPVMEVHWGGSYFPMGLVQDFARQRKGVVFDGTLTNVVLDSPSVGLATFDFIMTAESSFCGVEFAATAQQCIEGGNGAGASESDPTAAGFTGWTGQFELHGSGVAPIVVLDPPSTVSGAALSASLAGTAANDGRITQAELESPAFYNVPADDESNTTCVGGCFAFTITGAAATEQMVLPLSVAIPTNAVYRKYINAAWITLDESAGDLVESAPGAQGDCSAVAVWTLGLSEGHFCVRLTIADGGLNDADGNPGVVDGTIVDPGGVGILATINNVGGGTITTLDDAKGCSISNSPNSISIVERADWLIVFAFIAMLGLLRIKRA